MKCNFLFSFFDFFWLFFCVWAQLGNFWGTFFLFKFFWADENFSVLGLFFWLFVLGLTELGGLFWNPLFFLIYGGSIKGTFFGLFFGPFLVWAHLRDLFESFFWHNLKFLGTLLFFPGHIQGPLWSFLKTPLSQSIFEKPLKP